MCFIIVKDDLLTGSAPLGSIYGFSPHGFSQPNPTRRQGSDNRHVAFRSVCLPTPPGHSIVVCSDLAPPIQTAVFHECHVTTYLWPWCTKFQKSMYFPTRSMKRALLLLAVFRCICSSMAAPSMV